MGTYDKFTVTSSRINVKYLYEYNDGPSQVAQGMYNNMVKSTGYDGSNEVPALSPVVCGVLKSPVAFTAEHAAPMMELDKNNWTTLEAVISQRTCAQG